MRLGRVYAYSVSPQRTTTDVPGPNGGEVPINAELRNALNEASQTSKLESRTIVDFSVDTTTRTNDVRDSIMTFAFGTTKESQTAAYQLAEQLGKAMDLRSAPCLFLIASRVDGDQREVTLWTFPRDDAFQFRGGARGPTLKLLSDIFSRNSKLRKAALLEGLNRRTDFLNVKVLDYQSSSIAKEVADFWIGRFLRCVLAIGGETGTRLLARCFRKAFDEADNSGKEQIFAAINAVKHSPRRRWSLRDVANNHLDGQQREMFLSAAPNDDACNSSFDFKREIFNHVLNYRVFQLEGGVFVSTPFDQVDKSVFITGREKRHLRCEGIISSESVKMHRG